MSYRVTQENILLLSVDAVAISVELELSPSETPLCQAVAAAGGESLREALIACRHFLPVGSAMEMTPGELPCAHLILTAVPVWASGKSNELLILHRCYKSVFQLAESLGCESIDEPGDERRFRADDDEIGPFFLGPCRNAGDVFRADRQVHRYRSRAGVAGGGVKFVFLFILREAPQNRVFPPAASCDKNLHFDFPKE